MKLCLGCMHELSDDMVICPNCGYEEGTLPKEAYYLPAGILLGERYIIGKVLGYGGFGITYIGYDELLKRIVAIKEYFPSNFATRGLESRDVVIYSGEANEQYQAGLQRFISEAKRLAQFNQSDNIVHIYDCIQENKTGYIIMEYLEGKTVKELLKEKKKLEYNEAEKVILEVLKALEEVHALGIIHRDVAPDNIFIMKNGQVRLLDFGAARYAVSEKTKSLSVILKPGYAPEEQYRTHGEQGPWTDIYGAGATFYKMITGIQPEESVERLLHDEIKKPSEFGIQISEAKENAIMKSVAVRKEDRFQKVSDFRKALVNPQIGKVLINEENSKRSDSKKWQKKALGGAIIICVGLVICWYVYKNKIATLPAETTATITSMPSPVSVAVISPTSTPMVTPTSVPTPKVTVSPTPVPEATKRVLPIITSTPIPMWVEENSSEKSEKYVVNVKNSEDIREISIINKTKFNCDTLQILKASMDKDEIVWKSSKDKKTSENNLSLEENDLYCVKLKDKVNNKILIFYNLDLTKMSRINLHEKDGYTYIAYKSVDGKEKNSMKDYRTSTNTQLQTLYALTSLNVRDLPDTENGKIISKYAIGDTIQIYGVSVGKIYGKESNWYLVKTVTGYGYISAETAYTTSDKSIAETKAMNLNTNTKENNSSVENSAMSNNNSYVNSNDYSNGYEDYSSADNDYGNSDSGDDYAGDNSDYSGSDDIDWSQDGIDWE